LLADSVSAAFFNGGPAFIEAQAYSNVEILARYRDVEGFPAAIILCRVGKGKALLSGVHPCYSFTEAVEDCYVKNLLLELEKIDFMRKRLFKDLLIQLDLLT
ncbi:MAG: BPL-N domain-containing protein, partial [Chlamydiota bacterium]